MAKKISFGLNSKEVQNAIKEVKSYQKDIYRKCEKLCKKLNNIGYKVALEKISESPIGKTVVLHSEISSKKTGCKAMLISVGEVKHSEGHEPFNTLLAIEFGAGIYYNSTANPKANELGMGVGTFPGQIHAFSDGWYYLEEDNEWHYTHGVKATMPMYFAGKEMKEKIETIAKEVFSI